MSLFTHQDKDLLVLRRGDLDLHQREQTERKERYLPSDRVKTAKRGRRGSDKVLEEKVFNNALTV